MFKFFYLIMVVSILFLASCKSNVGDPCEDSSDCEVDLVCEESFEDGYCLKFYCNIDDEESCPSEAQCTLFEDTNTTYCLRKCNTNEDCRSKYECKAIDSNEYRVCFPK